jgi:Major capsid protein N-terminus/Large eukaryotic DNA virus major capsid protein
MSSICSSNLTSGFIDLATFDEQEKYLYGGPDAVAYFVRETRKSTWYTIVPVVLSRASGQPQFGQEWSVTISRAGDYLINTWLRVTIPSVTLANNNQFTTNGRLRWTRNLMHNLVREAAITFNDLVAARFDNYHLDFWSAFTVPAGKRTGYNNMIGNINELIQPTAPGVAIPSVTLNLPLPFFYTRDSGVALPTAALPYNDIRITFSFRSWNELLVLDNSANASASANWSTTPAVTDLVSEPQLQCVQVWSTYAIVSSDERKRMACAPRDILIEQVQTAPIQTYVPNQNSQPSYDIRFSHSIKALFFAVRNKTVSSEWSNYTCASPVYIDDVFTFYPPCAVDPILNTSLIYENTSRLACMGSDYFSLVNPWYHAPVIPLETGYHMYSYSLDFFCLDPMGSTNYGKLTNVSIVPQASESAITASNGSGVLTDGCSAPQRFDFITTAINFNIIRISGKYCAASNSELPIQMGITV